MQPDSNERKSKNKHERARFVNVIYFIDSNRTHSFQLKLRTTIIVGGTIALLLLWSFVGTFLLISESSESAAKSQRIRGLLATIFNYQTRYDQVYERTYPEDGNYLLASDEPEETKAPETSPAIKPEPSPAAKPEPVIALAAKPVGNAPEPSPVDYLPEIPTPLLKFQHTYADDDLDDDELDGPEVPARQTMAAKPIVPIQAETIPKDQAPPIDIENVESNKVDSELEFKFALRNTDSPNLASGYVIGVARFKDSKGQVINISSPPDIAIDQQIPFARLSRNHRFSIRYHKTKTLKFSPPAGSDGHFEAVHIIVGDTEGNRKEIVYNIAKDKIESVRGISGPGIKENGRN